MSIACLGTLFVVSFFADHHVRITCCWSHLLSVISAVTCQTTFLQDPFHWIFLVSPISRDCEWCCYSHLYKSKTVYVFLLFWCCSSLYLMQLKLCTYFKLLKCCKLLKIYIWNITEINFVLYYALHNECACLICRSLDNNNFSGFVPPSIWRNMSFTGNKSLIL